MLFREFNLEDAREVWEEEAREEGREEGRSAGIQILITTCRQLGLSRQEIEVKLADGYHLTPEAAKGYVEKYWQT